MPVTFRVDKFVVPPDAREQFWANARRTHAVLREQPGFLDDALLEQVSGQGRFTIVTIVRWASGEDLTAAGSAVAEAHRAVGFDPAAFFAEAGIEADLGNYTAV